MKRPPRPEDLLEFPCDFVFKAFGSMDDADEFEAGVRAAIEAETPVDDEFVKRRPSTKGTYLCVSVGVRVADFDQMTRIYAALRQVNGLKYLL